jgi:hypothetical protein
MATMLGTPYANMGGHSEVFSMIGANIERIANDNG